MGKSAFWLRLLGALATAAATAALFPPFNAGFLVWISFAPLLAALWSVEGKRAAWKGFGWGFLAGAGCHLIQLNWLSVVSPIGAVVLPLYLGVFWGMFGAFAATWGNPGKQARGLAPAMGIVFANAAAWSLFEWLRGWLFTGFGWNGLGVGFHENRVFSQAADILGVSGLSLFLVFLQGLFVLGARSREARVLVPAAALVTAVFCYGKYSISRESGRKGVPLRTLLVQNNIPQDAARYLWDPARIHMAYEDATLEGLARARASGTFPDWVVWPESALTGRILRTGDGRWGTWRENSESFDNVREGGDFTLIFGAVELEAAPEGEELVEKADGETYNSLVALSPAAELQTFRKHHLVIFGETIPFVESIPLLKKIYEQQAGAEYHGSFAAGGSFEPLSAAARGRTIGIIPTVCFEDTVPRLTRRFLKPGPQVIVNVTNDGWFKESPAAAQHFANARFRAIELRRPMIRCANTGVTAAINSSGGTRILTDEKGSHFTSGTLLVDLNVPEKPATTLYGLIGDAGIIVTGLAGMGIPLFIRRKNRRLAETTV